MKRYNLGIVIGTLLCSGLFLTGNARCEIISDFDDGVPDWTIVTDRNGDPNATESGGRLSLSMRMPACNGDPSSCVGGVGWNFNDPIEDAQILELSVNVLKTSRGDVISGIEYNCREKGLYGLFVNQDGMWLEKVDYGSGLVVARLFQESRPLTIRNVTLCLSLTGVGESVRITGQLLDKDNNNALLVQRTVLDTPGIDPTVAEAPGIANLDPDPGKPYRDGVSVFLPILQMSDGNQPVAEVEYDNLTYEYRSAAVLNIESAVRLAWPAFSIPFSVEGASTVDGPWTEVTEPVFQVDGVNSVTVPVPAGKGIKVFRLQEVIDP